MRSTTRLLLLLSLGLLLPAAHVPPAQAAWPSDPRVNVTVCDAAGSQANPRACSDGAGGLYVTWQDSRSGTAHIYAQHLDRDGVPLWAADGVVVCDATGSQTFPAICPSLGGPIIAWQDTRNGNLDIFVQRLDPHGAPLWAANGVALCTAANVQQSPVIADDGANGAYVAWQDFRNGADYNVYMRRINSSGSPQWSANGEVVCDAAGLQSGMTIAAGTSIVAWVDGRGADTKVYAQKAGPTGTMQWAADGVALCTAAGDEGDVALAHDGLGGVVAAWADLRSGAGDIYVQHVEEKGTITWAEEGVAVCTAVEAQVAPAITRSTSGEFVVCWQDFRNSSDYGIYVQKLGMDGATLWTANGVSLCTATGSQFAPAITEDGAGGAIVAWVDTRSGEDHLYSRRVSASGTPQWAANGVALCTAAEVKNGLCIVPNTEGGAIVAWAGARGSSSADLYAQRVDRFGAIGEAEPVITAIDDLAGDQGGRVVLEWTASYLDADPAFAIEDYSVWRQVPSHLVAPALARGAAPAGSFADPGRRALRATTAGALTEYWEYVGSTPARAREGYSFVAATPADSAPGANPLTRFMVSAEALGYPYYWDSAPDSGYSVDDLAPPTPAPFTGDYAAGIATLQWGASPAPDFAAFRLHRGDDWDFVPDGANLVTTTTASGYVDACGDPAIYKLCALDVHGNASPYAVLQPDGTVDVAPTVLPREVALSAPSPNPLRGSTTLRLALPRSAPVELAIHDQQGRRVRTLLAGSRPAGESPVTWDGRDEGGRPVPSGMYFVRCRVEGRTFTRRVAALR